MTKNIELLSGDECFIKGKILCIDKPLEWTSFQVVNKMRYMLCQKLKIKKLKVGHAGTLDPKATGLLIVCTGKATKGIDLIQAQKKEYIATIKLGATTPSLDLETEESERFETSHISQQLVEEALLSFTGTVEQVPPIFSAIRINGKRAYEHARKGEEVEMKSREITIPHIELLSYAQDEIKIRVECSKGTYIRSLARDIGAKLDSGGYLTGLIRTKIGDYTIENAISIEEFEAKLLEIPEV